MTVLEKFYQGDKRALSKVISFVENRQNGYRDILGELYSKAGEAIRIGITGPPGAGKSTLVNRLTHLFLNNNLKVGIIAVDPSSPFTGGALLGDRVRMSDFHIETDVFFRSMATRGASGGLASATSNVSIVLDAFGFDIILIETVGVGQVELDIVDACDSVVVVMVPESGDSVQTMKAGLMEIADIFVVNKSDRPNSQRIVTDLKQSLQTKKAIKESEWKVPVIPTIATDDKNVDKLTEKIEKHIEYIKSSGQLEEKRYTQLTKKIIAILKNRFEKEFLEKLITNSELEEQIKGIIEGETNPYDISNQLFEKFSKNL
jgi:LAO/AO transport system kinase